MSTNDRSIKDVILYDHRGKAVKLSRLFGTREQLVILHNMGKACPNCALWGDEFNGMLKHLEKVAAFCVVGPDDPQTQKEYARERGWKSKLYSAQGTSFIKEMGFEDKQGRVQPGISVLQKRGGKISILEQVNVGRDGRAPSVLEVLWMVPRADVHELAWAKGRGGRTKKHPHRVPTGV